MSVAPPVALNRERSNTRGCAFGPERDAEEGMEEEFRVREGEKTHAEQQDRRGGADRGGADEDKEDESLFGGEDEEGDAAGWTIYPTEGKREPLGQEPEEGNVEYKLKLVQPTPERLQHLTTQLKWRLAEGVNEAIYEVGVHDDGTPLGLTDRELGLSLLSLESMAASLEADCQVRSGCCAATKLRIQISCVSDVSCDL